jgi:hypothetical protein
MRYPVSPTISPWLTYVNMTIALSQEAEILIQEVKTRSLVRAATGRQLVGSLGRGERGHKRPGVWA